MHQRYFSSGPEGTAQIARRFAAYLFAGDSVLLHGVVGAGKSHFARAVIRQFLGKEGDSLDIPSPTFTLVQSYEANGEEIWHCDLYRLTHVDELLELGLEMAFETAICLVEWPQRLGSLAPQSAVRLDFEITGDNTRNITMHWTDPKWSGKIDKILAD